MKLLEKVCGSVQSCGFATTQGSLLFISHKEVLITAGDDGNQLCFLKSEEEVNCIAAAQNEGIVVVGFNWGIQVCRLLSGQASCRSISRILEHEISPKESSLGTTEKNFKLPFPVRRLAISANGRTIATVSNERNDLQVFRLSYNQEGAIQIEECFHEHYNDNITEFGFSNEKLYVVQSKFVYIFNNEFNQTKVGHPGKILHIDWRLSDDDDSVFLTHSNCILRLWSGQDTRIQLLASKSSPDMTFSFLNNSYYSPDETDYLVGISKGNFHLWSVSNLKKNNRIKPVVISTLRMIPNIYPNTSLSIKMHIQVRPYLARMSELPLKRAGSMFSLSPSITNSISMASVGASQKIFVDVVDSDGNLVTLTLSSSTNSFGDTTSIKSLCQASGHPADITTIDAHPDLPVIATGDEHGNVFIVKRLINKAHHKSVFKFDSEVVLKWIQSPEEMTSQILLALEKKSHELIIHSIIIDNGVMKRKQSWNLSISNFQRVYCSNSKLIISCRDKNLLIDPLDETFKQLEINSDIVGISGQQQDFFISRQRNSLSSYHVTNLKTTICPSLTCSDENILLAGPGLVLTWTDSRMKIECSLHSTTHTGFEMWELLDTLTIEKCPNSFSENPKAFIFEHPNLTSTVFFILGRTILTVNVLQQPPTHYVSVSPKGKIYLLSRFHTPGTLKKPTFVERLDLKHFIAVCGKSLLLLQSEPSWSRPSYSPIALQKIINLGRVNMARGILTSFVDFFRSSVKSSNQKEKMIAEIFTDSNVSEIRPSMPPLLTLLDQSFGSNSSAHDSTRRRKSVMDPDTNDFERRLSADLEKDLVLDFSSSESECSDEELDASEVTVSDILMRYRLAGITRSEQVTLEAIWECLNTVIPAGIDRAGTTFMLQWHHHRCMTKYLRSAPLKGDLPSSAIIWAFHSESQAEILSIIMESPDFSWHLMKLTGVAFWCKSIASLRLSIEKLSRLIFQKEKDPMQVIVWYSILGKEKILSGLFKSVNNLKMSQFFGNDFSVTRWKQAALKNAFALLGKRRYLEAIGFFLIGGALTDALDVAQNRLHDNCLTLLIARLHSGQDLYLEKLKELSKEDSFTTSMFYWLEGNQIESVAIFLESEVCRKFDPAKTFNFYKFLSKHPLYTKALSIHGKNISSASQERVLCSRAVFEHLVSGCSLPAMITLESLPKINKKITKTEVSLITSNYEPNLTLENSSAMNWGDTELIKEKTLDLNWGEPEPVQEEGLDLEWSDEENSESENESPPQNHVSDSVNASQVASEDGPDILSDEISKSALTAFFLQEFSLTTAKEESSVDLDSIIQNYIASEADLRSIWPGYCPSLSTLIRKNRAFDSAKFQTSLKIHLESFQVCFPLLSFVRY